MVVITAPIRFPEDDPRPMLRHLDDWARERVTSPEAWSSVLERCDQWLDYSARNQILLASYGVIGPVAGVTTWDRVPSREAGRGCAVRRNEHGLPVRVPVVGESVAASERSRSGATTASSAVEHRWELVFAEEQLARRPHARTLAPPSVVTLSEKQWIEAVRVASGRMLGRTPRRIDDPGFQLARLAAAVPLGAGRVALRGDLAAQAARLAVARAGVANDPLPVVEPSGLHARERWRTLVDVRHATNRLLDALSFAMQVDLRRSALPRHDLADDRAVAPERRNYLAPADLRNLPLGVWTEVGPYTKGEWLARGIAGASGVATFLRVNERSYLAAYESRGGAMWRLETTGRGAHHGLVNEGTSDNLEEAKMSARDALRERYPDIAQAVERVGNTRVASPEIGWRPMPDGRDERTEHRVFDDRVVAMVNPGPGGRWESWVSVDGKPRQGPLAADADAARTIADGLAHGALMELAAVTPDRANALVAESSASGSWNRELLVRVVGSRLDEADRADLAATRDPRRLTDLMADVGVLAPSTILQVLHAEDVSLDDVVPLAPTIGLRTDDAIRQIHELWDADRLDVGRQLGASVEELRSAGCSHTEMLAASPREELRRLDTREQTWSTVGATLMEAGYTLPQAIGHLAAHAPTPETFAAGVEAVCENPCDAISLSGRVARADDLAALTERYELSTSDAAAVMASVGVPTTLAVEVIGQRCPKDRDAACEFALEHLGLGRDEALARLDGIDPNVAVPLNGRTRDHALVGREETVERSDVHVESPEIQAALDQFHADRHDDAAGIDLERTP